MAIGLNILLWGIAALLIVYETTVIARSEFDELHENSADSRTHYIAAVVEYSPEGNINKQTPSSFIERNWENYYNYMLEAHQLSVDIIVFPECGLTTTNLPPREQLLPFLTEIPEPGSNPCSNKTYGGILEKASCAARETRMYTVINLPEMAPCSNSSNSIWCPEDGSYIFNTNVAFDREGTIVARYRKFNLFNEPGFDTTPEPEHSVFETDFGARFGIVICFDLLFKEPTLSLVNNHHITDMAYSAAWFSELPFLVASEVQQAWAMTTGVTLLAAGYDDPGQGNAGSGIYTTDAALSVMPKLKGGTSRMLVAKVPLRKPTLAATVGPPYEAQEPRASHHHLRTSFVDALRLYQDYMEPYNAVDINGTLQVRLCHDGADGGQAICCDFDVDMEIVSREALLYRYKAGVFSGVRNFGGSNTSGVQVCGVVACLPEDGQGLGRCGLSNESLTAEGSVFRRLSISQHLNSNETLDEESLYLPVSLGKDLLPLSNSQLAFNKTSDSISFSTTQPVSGLLAFGLWGRDFSLDGPQM